MVRMELTAAVTPEDPVVPLSSPGVDGVSGAAVVVEVDGGATVVDVVGNGGGVVVLVSTQSQ